LSFFGLVEGNASAKAVVQNAPAIAIGQGLPFAIADFDGDFRFDLASIEAWPNNSGTTDYWIQLQLSAVGRQSIRFVGAPGGLRLEARDVNKDRAVDLVLVSAWSRQPVAILLNDGRGGFSRVAPTAFPEAFTNLATTWSSAADQAMRCFRRSAAVTRRSLLEPKGPATISTACRSDSTCKRRAVFRLLAKFPRRTSTSFRSSIPLIAIHP
jgi:hypothetical protein